MVAKNYVRILVPYYHLMYYGILERYVCYSTLDLLEENIVFIYNKLQANITKNYVKTSGDFQQFSPYSLQ